MKRTVLLILAALCAFFYFNSLTFKIQKAIWGKDCTVSAAVIYDDYIWSFNNKKTPLMSVFKYFIALNALDKIEKENRSLEDKITVAEDMIIRETYTPMLKKYPKTPFEISFSNLIKYMVSESDNNAADILINYIGGMPSLQQYLRTHNLDAVEISADEKMMEKDVNTQYLNKARALDVLLAMKFFREEKSPLSKERITFLDKVMIETVTGKDKIKAGLPEGTTFGHKTGMSSRKPDGVRIAENDAGFVILPNGKTYYIAVFVTESKMSDKENTSLIAQISKIIYNKMLLR